MKTFLFKLFNTLLGGPLRRLPPRRFVILLRWLVNLYLDRGRWAAGPESPHADMRALFAVEAALRPSAAPPPLESAALPAHLAAFLKRAIAPQEAVLCAACPAEVLRLITLATGARVEAIEAPQGAVGVFVLGGHMEALPEALRQLAAWGESGAAALLLYVPRYEAERGRVLLHDPAAFEAAARAAGLGLLDQAFTWDALWAAFAPPPGAQHLPRESGGGTIGEMI